MPIPRPVVGLDAGQDTGSRKTSVVTGGHVMFRVIKLTYALICLS